MAAQPGGVRSSASRSVASRRHQALVAILAIVALAPASAHETITYSYDARGRLVQVVHSGDTNNGVVSAAKFDPADNRASYCQLSDIGGDHRCFVRNAGAVDRRLHLQSGSDRGHVQRRRRDHCKQFWLGLRDRAGWQSGRISPGRRHDLVAGVGAHAGRVL